MTMQKNFTLLKSREQLASTLLSLFEALPDDFVKQHGINPSLGIEHRVKAAMHYRKQGVLPFQLN